jgi:hypothetical protein
MKKAIAVILFVAGCSSVEPPTPAMDQAVFEPVYRASLALQTAVDSGDLELAEFRRLLQDYQWKVARVEDNTSTADAGNQLLQLHRAAIEVYDARYKLWRVELGEMGGGLAVRGMLAPADAYVGMATNLYFGRDQVEAVGVE